MKGKADLDKTERELELVLESIEGEGIHHGSRKRVGEGRGGVGLRKEGGGRKLDKPEGHEEKRGLSLFFSASPPQSQTLRSTAQNHHFPAGSRSLQVQK